MSGSQASDGMAMHPDALRDLAADVANLATALRDVQRYQVEPGLAPEHLGGTAHAAAAGARFSAVTTELGRSLGTAMAFTDQAARRLAESAGTTADADASAARRLPEAW